MRLRVFIKNVKTFAALFATIKSKHCHIMFTPKQTRVIATTNSGQMIDHSTGGVWATVLSDEIFESDRKIETKDANNTIVMEISDVAYMLHALRTIDKHCNTGTHLAAERAKITLKLQLLDPNDKKSCCLSLGGAVMGKAAMGQCDQWITIPVTILYTDEKMSRGLHLPRLNMEMAIYLDTVKHGAELATFLERFRLCRVVNVTVLYTPKRDGAIAQAPAAAGGGAAAGGAPPMSGTLELIGHMEQVNMSMKMALSNVLVDKHTMDKNVVGPREARRQRENEETGGDQEGNNNHNNVNDPNNFYRPRYSVSVQLKNMMSLMPVQEHGGSKGGMILFHNRAFGMWATNDCGLYVLGFVAANVDVDAGMAGDD